jgi:AraC-like DNA-binding protein
MSLLSQALQKKLLHGAPPQFIVARSRMSAAQMPDGVKLVRRKIIGERTIVRGRRFYGNVRSQRATWPEAGLGEWENEKMVCVLNGRIDFQIGHYAVQCGEGFFLIIPPGTPQPDGRKLRYHAENASCDLLNIVLHPHAVQCFITHSKPGQSRVTFPENYLFKNVRLAGMFDFLMQEMIEGDRNANGIGVDLLSAFLKILQRELDEGHYINPGPLGRPLPQHEKTDDFHTELLRYVQAHLNQNLTLENVAHGLYLSRTQFIRRVRETTGKSFVQFLTDYRIAEAKVLLRDSDWTIAAIAGFLGFKNPAYFHSVFQRKTGQTPGQFRKG